MPHMKKASTILILLCTIILPCIAASFLPIINNNYKLSQLGKSIVNYPLPHNTRIVAIEKKLTSNTGNGKYCIFSVTVNMASTLEQQDIIDYYKKVSIEKIVGEYDSPHIWVDFKNTQTKEKEILFVVNVRTMTERFFDIRC